MLQFTHILSVAALASVAVAAPQYYYLSLTPVDHTRGYDVPRQAAIGVILKLSLGTRFVECIGGCAIGRFLRSISQKH